MSQQYIILLQGLICRSKKLSLSFFIKNSNEEHYAEPKGYLQYTIKTTQIPRHTCLDCNDLIFNETKTSANNPFSRDRYAEAQNLSFN
jgi:uncharacterized protein with PIN domain